MNAADVIKGRYQETPNPSYPNEKPHVPALNLLQTNEPRPHQLYNTSRHILHTHIVTVDVLGIIGMFFQYLLAKYSQGKVANTHSPRSPTMSTSNTQQAALPSLPHNVLIFSPSSPDAAKALLNGRIFTKLASTGSTTPAQLVAAVQKITPKESREKFCLPFRKGILIFDGSDPETEQEKLTDDHHEHFREVCLALKDADINLDFSACIFDADQILKAGFQLDAMSQGAVLVIDLMDAGDDDDDDDSDEEDEDDEVTEAKLNALVHGNTVQAQ